jgi:hypothetical protein
MAAAMMTAEQIADRNPKTERTPGNRDTARGLSPFGGTATENRRRKKHAQRCNQTAINDLEGVDRVPYRLPDVLQFPGATLFVCEGEKDTDNCSALGLCATTAAGGKWTTSCIRALTGREAPFADGEDRFSAPRYRHCSG